MHTDRSSSQRSYALRERLQPSSGPVKRRQSDVPFPTQNYQETPGRFAKGGNLVPASAVVNVPEGIIRVFFHKVKTYVVNRY